MPKLNEERRVLLKVKQNEQGSANGITAAMSATPKMDHGRRAGQERGGKGRGGEVLKVEQNEEGLTSGITAAMEQNEGSMWLCLLANQ
ncbi:uncharacterized protein AKAME5_002555700 [Lates japonicus]|nr:uncharacterized protein AKAME5_002555700 [Lates japonicus]